MADGALVDTGSEYTGVPRDVLESPTVCRAFVHCARATICLAFDTAGRCVAAARTVLCFEAKMRQFRLGANVAVFLLFFGISLLDAFRAGDWVKAAFWLAIGLVFLRADSLRRAL